MRNIITSLLILFIGLSTLANIPNNYYNNAIGKKDEALMTALEGIIYTHTKLSYNYMWTAYDSTDVGDDGYYIDMYSNCKYNHNSTHVAGASYVGEGINREHSFPKSWFGGEVDPMFTDLTMLIPTDAFVNQRRSNYPYGVCAGGITYTTDSLGVTMLGKLGTSTYNGYTSTVFEPDDEYKGDFARIYFYMVTCYKSVVSTWPGSGQLDYETNQYKAFSNWSLQLLMEWHRADPVSAKEIARNEAVYKEQGNRNPFVDHPELAEYIWGIKQNTSWTGQDIPVDPLDKRVPVMYDVDTTSIASGTFRADWSNAGDVSSYTLKVNRIASADESTILLMSENFSNVTATSDGGTDISSSLDKYTDNPGWTGYKLYVAANNGLKVGTSKAIGYLTSPELELGNTVTVVFNAKNWISSNGTSDNSSVIVSCGGVNQIITLSDTPDDYTVVLTGCTEKNVQLKMVDTSKRFYVYHVDIYNGDINANVQLREVVEEGDSTWRNISGITDTCYTVQALAAGVYEYMVKAIYTDGDESIWSNIQHVRLAEGAVGFKPGDVDGDGEVTIGDVSALISYLLTGGSYDIDKRRADVDGDGEVSVGDVSALISLLLNN